MSNAVTESNFVLSTCGPDVSNFPETSASELMLMFDALDKIDSFSRLTKKYFQGWLIYCLFLILN